VDPQLKRALSQALRVEILERIATNPASPRQIAGITGEPVGRVTYHTSVLRQTSCIRAVDPDDDSDPSECVYEIATLLPPSPRLPLSDSTRGHVLASVLRRIVEQGLTALRAGTLGRRPDSKTSCEAISVDRQGWQETQAILEETANRIAAVKAAASERLAKNDEPAIRMTVALAAFEAAPDGTADA
jgi:hypothetical protein